MIHNWAEEMVVRPRSVAQVEEEATSTIVRGFLNVDIPGLPPELQAEIDRAIEESDKDVM